MVCVVVTGASRGIGLELCRQYQARGDAVIGVCRAVGQGLRDLGIDVIEGVDVSEPASCQVLAGGLAGRSIDILVNNAGILARDTLETLDFEVARRQFVVNSLGPLLVTRALLPNLERGSRVGIVSSRMGSIGDNRSGGFYGYRMSKAAANMAGVNLALDLADRGIAVMLLHPGMVATDMTGHRGIPIEAAAAGLIRRLDELNLANSGSFRHAEGEALPW